MRIFNGNRFKDKSVVIAGSGVSGEGAKRALTAAGANCRFYDGRLGCDFAVASPGIPLTDGFFERAKAEGVDVMGELELGCVLNGDRPFAAVTGTNGKTTTSEMTAAMLKGGYKISLCGNIGRAFSEAAVFDDYEAAVVEASSFQLESVRTFKPAVAAILNITPDHLDRHGSLQNYARIKRRIAENQSESDFLVLSFDDIPSGLLEGFAHASETFYFAMGKKVKGAYFLSDALWFCGKKICSRDRLKADGEHNVKNALAAICIASLMGAERTDIADALSTYEPGEHRIALIGHRAGKNWYDDSKGTNIAATLSACRAMPSSACLIAGGSDKGYDYAELFAYLPKTITYAAVIGQTGPAIIAAAKEAGFKNTESFDSLNEAVAYASSLPVENVLLSPASASFDMFEDYRARGRCFAEAVKELKP